MFKNQHVVITGGSSGLGLELAHQLAEKQARLTLIARNTSKLNDAKDRLIEQHPNLKVQVRSVDVCNEAEVIQVMNEIADSVFDGEPGSNLNNNVDNNDNKPGIDILINSAGILREGHFEELPMQDFRDVMEINFFGILNAIRAALPHLKKSKGRVVNIASMAGLAGVFGYTSYCSSKHALVGLSESLRYELKPLDVKVHLVCPGEFDSPMVDKLDSNRTNENRAHAQTIPRATVEKIASHTLAGIQSNQFMIIPGILTRAAAFSVRHLIGVSRRLGDNIVARAQKNKQPPLTR